VLKLILVRIKKKVNSGYGLANFTRIKS
jgi:hypothetical protein